MASILATEAGVELPTPATMSVSHELLWSANTKRVASGRMVGTAIAEKQTVNITWGVLTKSELDTIKSQMPKGFFKLQVFGNLIEVYRGAIASEPIGNVGDGAFYYRSASTDIIER